MRYKILGVFFIFFLLVSFAIAQESSITAKAYNKVEVSSEGARTEVRACKIPACEGAKATGEYYDDGCPKYGCPTEQQKVELILEKQYKPGEKIEIKLKNNLNRPIYYSESGCGVKDNAYIIYQLYSYYKETPTSGTTPGSSASTQTVQATVSGQAVSEGTTNSEDDSMTTSEGESWVSGDEGVSTKPVTARKLVLLDYCLPCPTLYLDEGVRGGETVFIDNWNQLEFGNACPESGKQTGKQVPSGDYQINFEYSEKVDLSNKKTVSNIFKIFKCPENCICEKDVIGCRIGEETPIETQVASQEGEIRTIKIKRVSEKEISIESSEIMGIATTTSQKIIAEENKLYTETSAGKKQIILPEEAANKASENTEVSMGNIESIELGEEDNKPVYSIKTTKKVKVFAFIPAKMKIKAKINAEDGQIISVKSSWWSFLAKK